jgi:hypothetical protein
MASAARRVASLRADEALRTAVVYTSLRFLVAPVIHHRQLGYAFRSGTFKHVGRRAVWRVAARDAGPAVPLTWPISEDMAAAVRIRWPTRINPGRPSLADCVNRIKSGIAAHVPIEHADIRRSGRVVGEGVIGGGRWRCRCSRGRRAR